MARRRRKKPTVSEVSLDSHARARIEEWARRGPGYFVVEASDLVDLMARIFASLQNISETLPYAISRPSPRRRG